MRQPRHPWRHTWTTSKSDGVDSLTKTPCNEETLTQLFVTFSIQASAGFRDVRGRIRGRAKRKPGYAPIPVVECKVRLLFTRRLAAPERDIRAHACHLTRAFVAQAVSQRRTRTMGSQRTFSCLPLLHRMRSNVRYAASLSRRHAQVKCCVAPETA